jgi:hypothetical protein
MVRSLAGIESQSGPTDSKCNCALGATGLARPARARHSGRSNRSTPAFASPQNRPVRNDRRVYSRVPEGRLAGGVGIRYFRSCRPAVRSRCVDRPGSMARVSGRASSRALQIADRTPFAAAQIRRASPTNDGGELRVSCRRRTAGQGSMGPGSREISPLLAGRHGSPATDKLSRESARRVMERPRSSQSFPRRHSSRSHRWS